jgi:hypothetical protein
VSTPSLPVPLALRGVCVIDPSRVTLTFVVVLLSLAPPSIAATLNDLTLLLALIGTYFLPGTRSRCSYSAWLFLHMLLCSLRSCCYTLPPTASVHRDALSLGPKHPPRLTRTFSATQLRPSSSAEREVAPTKAVMETDIMGCWRLVANDTYQFIWTILGWRADDRKMVTLDLTCHGVAFPFSPIRRWSNGEMGLIVIYRHVLPRSHSRTWLQRTDIRLEYVICCVRS